jgi:hypothetical protein
MIMIGNFEYFIHCHFYHYHRIIRIFFSASYLEFDFIEYFYLNQIDGLFLSLIVLSYDSLIIYRYIETKHFFNLFQSSFVDFLS